MNELWVARDDDGFLCVFSERPVKEDGDWHVLNPSRLVRSIFPDLMPGQCRRLVLAEETSE